MSKTSYLNPFKAIKYLFEKPQTIKYPFETKEIADRYRGFHKNDWEKCIGCGDCAVICDKAISSLVLPGGIVKQREKVPPVLEIIDGTVQVVNWRSCKRTMDPPEYCRVCEEKCPSGALELVR